MNLPVIVYNNMDVIYDVAQSLARMRGSASLNTLIAIGLSVGHIMIILQTLGTQNIKPAIMWMLTVTLILGFLYVPTYRVVIHDSVLKQEIPVDNVPLGAAFLISATTMFSEVLAKMYETEFVDPGAPIHHYRSHGMLMAPKMLLKMQNQGFSNARIAGNFERFASSCVVKDYRMAHSYSVEDLSKDQDLWKMLKEKSSKSIRFEYIGEEGAREYLTCRAGANGKLNTELLQELGYAKKNIVWKLMDFFDDNPDSSLDTEASSKTKTALNGAITNTLKANMAQSASFLTGMAEDGNHALRQGFVINWLQNVPEYYANSVGSGDVAAAWATYRAKELQYNNGMVMGEMAASGLSTLYNLFQYIFYGSFYLILILALLPGMGVRVMMAYAGLMIWISSWPPLYALLNHFLLTKMRASSLAVAAHLGLEGDATLGWTAFNNNALMQHAQEQVAYAGIYLLSVPVIATMLVRGAGSFVHLAGHMTSVMSQSAGTVAQEKTDANYSYGNVSDSNTQAVNTSLNKHDATRRYSGAGMDFEQQDGTRLAETVGGRSMANHGPGMSNLMAGVNLSQAFNQGLFNQHAISKTNLSAASENYGNTLSNVASDAVNFMNNSGHNVSKDTRFSSHEAADIQNSVDKVNGVHDDFKNTFGLTDNESVALSTTLYGQLGANAGVNGKLSTGGIAKIFESKVAAAEAIGDTGKANVFKGLLSKVVGATQLGDVGATAGVSAGVTGDVKGTASVDSRKSNVFDHAMNTMSKADNREAFSTVIRYAKDATVTEGDAHASNLQKDVRKHLDESEVASTNYNKALQDSESLSKIKNHSEQSGVNIGQNMQQPFFEFVASSADAHGNKFGPSRASKELQDPVQAANHAQRFIASHVQELSDNYHVGTPSEQQLEDKYQSTSVGGNLDSMRQDYNDGKERLTVQATEAGILSKKDIKDSYTSLSDDFKEVHGAVVDNYVTRKDAIENRGNEFQNYVENEQSKSTLKRTVSKAMSKLPLVGDYFAVKPFDGGAGLTQMTMGSLNSNGEANSDNNSSKTTSQTPVDTKTRALDFIRGGKS